MRYGYGLAAVLVWTLTASAATRTATPATVQSQLAQMRPGDTLLLASGTYQVRLDNLLPSGVGPQQPTVLQAAPGARVTLRPPDGGRDTCGICIRGRSHIMIRGLHIDLAAVENCGVSITGGSHHITLTQNRLTHLHDARQAPNGGGAICTSEGTSQNTITHNTVDQITAQSSRVHGIYVAGATTRIEGNTVVGSPGYGIHIYSDSANRQQATAGNQVVGNRLVQNDRGIFAMGQGTHLAGNTHTGNRTLDVRWAQGSTPSTGPGGWSPPTGTASPQPVVVPAQVRPGAPRVGGPTLPPGSG